MTLAYNVYLGLILMLVAAWCASPRWIPSGVQQPTQAGTRAMLFSVILFTLLIGGRYNVGGDFFGYIDYYRQTTLSDGFNDVVFEPGFLLLIQILKFFGMPERAIIFASSFLQITLFSLWLRKHQQIAPFAVFSFMVLMLLDINNTVRQGIAFFAILLALSAITERRWFTFVGWGLFAYLFHRSALIIFPIGIGLNFLSLPKVWLQAAALGFSYVFLDLYFDWIVGLYTQVSSVLDYSGYAEINRADLAFSKQGSSSLGLGIYLWPVVDIVIILFSRKISDHYKPMRYPLYHNFYLIAALLQPVANSWDFIPFARGLFYFVAMRAICVGFVLHYCLAVSRRPRDIMVALGFGVVFLAYLMVAISRGAALSAPYQFF